MQFHEYLDGALTEIERLDFERHLQTCGECREQLKSVEKLFAAIGSVPDLELDTDLAPAIVHAIDAQKRSVVPLKWTAVAQALLGITLLGITWPILSAGATQIRTVS